MYFNINKIAVGLGGLKLLGGIIIMLLVYVIVILSSLKVM